MDPAALDEIASQLTRAERVMVITGAGISADSGLPTYRGVGGLYEDAATPEGMAIEDVLSGQTMADDPALCWRYLGQVEAACRGASPNRGHDVIAALADRCEVVLLTQNVDGLHARAGSSGIEIHGNLHRLRCTACDWRDEVTDYTTLAIPPRCPRCGGWVRPDVVLFGETLPFPEVHRLRAALQTPFDLVFSIGTTSGFPYIAGPVQLQWSEGRPVVEINPGDTAVSRLARWRLRTGAAAALDALWARLDGAS